MLILRARFLFQKFPNVAFGSRASFSSSKNLKNDNQSHNSKVNDYFDIVICGGGMVGNAMAAALGQENLFKNLKIALIDTESNKEQYQSPQIHRSRVCALSSTTIDLLKSIDSWDFIEQHRSGEVHNMHVWDGSSDAFISFKKEDGSNLAWIVENDLIVASLTKNLSNFKNVKVFYSNKIEDFKQNDQAIDIKLKDDSNITTKLLIGSDGGNSFIRKKANIGVLQWNYDQVAIVATMKLANKTQNFTAWQRFLSTGPIALLPLNDEYSSLVWSIKKNMMNNLLELSDEEFVHKVNQAFVNEDFKNEFGSGIENLVQNGIDWLRNVIPKGSDYFTDRETEVRILPPKIVSSELRASYPLSFLHSNNYVSKRLALIGDSIHKIHPLAGQGVNLGFGDVICLKQCLKDNLLSGNEIGSWNFLKDYESRRQRQAFPKMAGIDALNKLYTDYEYGNSLIKTPLVTARTIGLTLSNRVIPLKNFFVKQAMR